MAKSDGSTSPPSLGQRHDESVDRSVLLRSLGVSLADLRRHRGLTGEALGELVGFSQAKISKIERGSIRPSPDDVKLMVDALDAPPDSAAKLVELAVRLQEYRQARRAQPRRGSEGQHDFVVHEASARHVKVMECVVVPGLLQTSEYSRRVINGYYEITGDDVEQKWPEAAAAVSERVKRQEQLYDPDKTFEFVVLETVLLLRFTSPGGMLAQLDQIESFAALPNVTVHMVPTDAQLGFPPMHGFTVLDDELVLTELGGEASILRDPDDVEFYGRLFDHYAAHSLTDLGTLLDTYKRLYADLARPR